MVDFLSHFCVSDICNFKWQTIIVNILYSFSQFTLIRLLIDLSLRPLRNATFADFVASNTACMHYVTLYTFLVPKSPVGIPGSDGYYHLNICARDKQLFPYTCLIISSVSAAVFKTEFNVRSLLHSATGTASSYYLNNMAAYFPSCSAWDVAVLPH